MTWYCPSCIVLALVGFSVIGCTTGDYSDVPDRTRVQCESEWQGDIELAGDESLHTACTRACRSHARKDFEEAAMSCQSVFRLTQRRSSFGTYVQCPVCSINYPDSIRVGRAGL